MTVYHVGARPQLDFKTPTISLRTVMQSQAHALACSYLQSDVAMGRSREPERTGRVEAAAESACDNLRNLAHARSASFLLASNCRAVTCCGRVRTSGGASSTDVCVSTNLQLCHGTGARGSIALLSDVEATSPIAFRFA
jgi:hypothetical protein